MKKHIWITITIVFTLFIWMQSILPGEISSEQSSFITQGLDRLLGFIHIHIEEETLHVIVRKLAHFTEYFILAWLWYHVLDNHKFLVLIYVLVTALIDESIQLIHIDRHASLVDVLIDFSGGLLMVLLLKIYDLLYNRYVFEKNR